MTKQIRLLGIILTLCFFAYSAQATTFYQNKNGEIIMEISNCEDASRFWELVEENTEPNKPIHEKQTRRAPQKFSEQDFNVAQAKLVAFVRDVNWKTGFHLTMRDANFFQRLKMICTGVIDYTKPYRVNLSVMYPDLENTITSVEDETFNALEKYAMTAAFEDAAELTEKGLRYAIITDQPFVLLLIDQGTYKELIKIDPQIEELANNLYMFFAYRSAYMGDEYNENTDELIDIAKLGQGDAVSTWKILAQFAQRMYELDIAGDLTPEQEKNIHIWRLQAAMTRVHHRVEVEKKAAKIAKNDPNNAELIEQINKEEPKKPTLKQEALKLLQNSTQEQVKELIRKYYGK